MNAVENQVRELVKIELSAANERFPQFHSQHEGYAVILEEICELEGEFNIVKEHLKDSWVRVMKNEHPEGSIKFTGDRAINVACEAVQVAAMCQKFLEMET